MANQSDAVISRAKPSPKSGDGVLNPRPRTSPFGESYSVVADHKPAHILADEGSYFVTTNPTPGTGLATIAAQASLADTAPFVLVGNGAAASSGVRIYFDYLKLIATAAGTAGTSIRFAAKIDTQPYASRFTSGGSALTPNNVNMDQQSSSVASVRAGAIVAAAGAGPLLLSNILLRPVIPVAADTYLIDFGGTDRALNSLAPAGTAIANCVMPHVPVVIGPGQCAAFHIWLPSQSAASSYEVELAWYER
jgi:hypothetical protein